MVLKGDKSFSINKKVHGLLKVQDENSLSRQTKAASLPKRSRKNFLSLLGDTEDPKYPIYMEGNLERKFINFFFCSSNPLAYVMHPICLLFRSHTLHTMHRCNKLG